MNVLYVCLQFQTVWFSLQTRETLYTFFDRDVDDKELGRLNAYLYALFPRFGQYCQAKDPYRKLGGFPKEILSLKSLTYLSLQYHGLTSIPDDIHQMAALEEINLSHNPYLVKLPAAMATLPLTRMEMPSLLLFSLVMVINCH